VKLVTLTANPSRDLSLQIARIAPGEVTRASAVNDVLGGKGINVARVAAHQGAVTVAVLPCRDDEVVRVENELTSARVEPSIVSRAGGLRTNVTLLEPSGRSTKVNSPGVELAPNEVVALIERILDASADADIVALCGSLPASAPHALYAMIAEHLPDADDRLIVDTSGAPLAEAVLRPSRLIKPNREELEALVGRELPSRSEVIAACREVMSTGPRSVLVSLDHDGAILVDAEGETSCPAPVVDVVDSTGAGDALLGGFLAAGTFDTTALEVGIACAARVLGRVGPLIADSDPNMNGAHQ